MMGASQLGSPLHAKKIARLKYPPQRRARKKTITRIHNRSNMFRQVGKLLLNTAFLAGQQGKKARSSSQKKVFTRQWREKGDTQAFKNTLITEI